MMINLKMLSLIFSLRNSKTHREHQEAWARNLRLQTSNRASSLPSTWMTSRTASNSLQWLRDRLGSMNRCGNKQGYRVGIEIMMRYHIIMKNSKALII